MMKNNTTTKVETCYGDKAYETIQELADGADAGDMLAAYYLAQYYEEGVVVPQDFGKAAELYMLVSESRDPWVFLDPYMPLTPQCEAEYAVGCLYEKGLLHNASMEKAMEWFQRSVKDGGHEACFKMAKLYLEGLHIELDYDESARYLYHGYLNFGHNNPNMFKLACELDGKTSTKQDIIWEILAHCYERGVGVLQDDMRAGEYHSKYLDMRSKMFDQALAKCSNTNNNDSNGEGFSF